MAKTSIWRFLCLIGLCWACAVYADQPDAKAIAEKVEKAIDRPLPTAAEVLGQEIETPAGPVVAIGYLENAGDGPDWGGAMGWYLMEAANGAFQELAVVPSYQYKSDGRGDPDDQGKDRKEQLKRVAERTGARFALAGKIAVREGHYDLDLALLEFPGGRQLDERHQSGELATLPKAVSQSAQALLGKAAMTASHSSTGTIAAPEPGELELLADAFNQAKTMPPGQRLDFYEKLWREHGRYLSVNSAYLSILGWSGDAARIHANLPALLAYKPPSTSLESYGGLLQSQYSSNGINPVSVLRMTKWVNGHPNAIGTWLALNDAYISEQPMYREDEHGMRYVISPAIDHHQGYANAIALGLEIVRRWPGHYRGWWSLSSDLQQYAGLVRGTEFWEDVPEDAQHRFKAIMAVAEECLREAIRLHPAQGNLYVNMIEFDVNDGRDWRPSFRRAAQLEPHWRRVYQTAFNYARPQWGGTPDDMREIYRLARTNNPDDEWPKQFRNEWAPEIKPLLDFDNPWVIGGLAALLSALLYSIWRLWRKVRE